MVSLSAPRRWVVGVSCLFLIASAAACGDDKGVQSLGDAYANLGGGGNGNGDGLPTDEEGSSQTSKKTCSLGSRAGQALMLYLPFDGNLNSRGRTETTSSSESPRFTEGKLGRGFQLSGSTVQLELGSSISLESPYTVCAWIAPAGEETTWLLQAQTSTGRVFGFGITGTDGSPCSSTRGRPFMHGPNGCAEASTSVSAGRFSLVCWAVQPGSGMMSVTVDASSTDSTSLPVSPGTAGSMQMLTLGGSSLGVVDELTFWSTRLTDEDISTLYAEGLGCAPSTSSSVSNEQ